MRGMTEETGTKLEAENLALRGENEQLRAEVAALEAQVKQLSADLAAALKKINQQVPSFVKPNRPKREGDKRARKKRAAEHNTSRQRSEPTRIERHALGTLPGVPV